MLFYVSPSGTSCHLPHQREALRRRVQHIFDEDAVSLRGVVDENVSDGADEVAILNDGTAAQV